MHYFEAHSPDLYATEQLWRRFVAYLRKERNMIYTELCGERVSLLGYGAMRLPTLGTDKGGEVDRALTEELIDLAMAEGINYFDTAYPYHGGMSEIILGQILSKYPRDSYKLATKYPGHQISSSYNPGLVFEDQLKKCGVDYFDFYLLHDVNETSVDTYLDKRWGIIDYFLEQKRLGRIKHLGFSTHARVEGLRAFLDGVGGQLDFCQIQLNYLDHTLQCAKEKYELLTECGIPIVVMEPVRGGKLANLNPELRSELDRHDPSASSASFAFRYLHGFDGVKVVLSGMSDMAQLRDNIKTFSHRKPLSPSELRTVLSIAERMKSGVPCTGCRYCTDLCPAGLDIPMLMETYNELSVTKTMNAARRVEFLPEGKRPVDCIVCGRCVGICPQGIDVPAVLATLWQTYEQMPKWAEICKKREEESKRLRKES